MPGVAFYRYSLANPAAELPELCSPCISRRQLSHPVTKSRIIYGIGEAPLLDAPPCEVGNCPSTDWSIDRFIKSNLGVPVKGNPKRPGVQPSPPRYSLPLFA